MNAKYPTDDDFGDIGPDVDLAKEEIFDSHDNRIDDAYAEYLDAFEPTPQEQAWADKALGTTA